MLFRVPRRAGGVGRLCFQHVGVGALDIDSGGGWSLMTEVLWLSIIGWTYVGEVSVRFEVGSMT